MSIETLKADLKANLAGVNALGADADLATVIRWFKDTWAFIESHVEETVEIDEAVSALMEDAVEVLHTETASVFSAVNAGALTVLTALRARLDKGNAQDADLGRICDELETNCASAKDILEEIVIDDEGDDDDEDDEDEEDDRE